MERNKRIYITKVFFAIRLLLFSIIFVIVKYQFGVLIHSDNTSLSCGRNFHKALYSLIAFFLSLHMGTLLPSISPYFFCIKIIGFGVGAADIAFDGVSIGVDVIIFVYSQMNCFSYKRRVKKHFSLQRRFIFSYYLLWLLS